MQSENLNERLKRARRQLDEFNQVNLIGDWEFDKQLDVWYLLIGVTIKVESAYIPKYTEWYITAQPEYPQGRIKVYPAARNGINVTYPHQANNSIIGNNDLWRKGALCLDVNTFRSDRKCHEMLDTDYRIYWHVGRALDWLEKAATNKLTEKGDLFELPEFILNDALLKQVAFSEDQVTFMQWDSVDERYGIVEMDVYRSNPFIYYAKRFKSIGGGVIHTTQWGTTLSQNIINPPIIAAWMLIRKVPVINVWQAPSTLSELIGICKENDIDLIEVLKEVSIKMRDGKKHLFLVGFPIPSKIGLEDDIVFWQAFELPLLSYGKHTKHGFRGGQTGWWMRDKTEILKESLNINWVLSENWNQKEISSRGRMDDRLIRKKILLIGAGCLRASVSEILVRSGIYSLTILDLDIFKVSNLVRHTLSIYDIGSSKTVSLVKHLNQINPHSAVRSIDDLLKVGKDGKANIDMNSYDIIIDCSGSNEVLNVISNLNLNSSKVFISVSVGLGARHLYLTMFNSNVFDFTSFAEIVRPYIESDNASLIFNDLPRDGIGCWHPTFPARSDDIWLAASTVTKTFEKYVVENTLENVTIVYEQKANDGVFEGYKVVEKIENR